jgi:hypothetical protein
MADKAGAFNKASFAKTNAIKARKKRLKEMADPENLEKSIGEIVTRMLVVVSTMTKQQMAGRPPEDEWRVVRPMARATVAEALLAGLAGHFPELRMADGVTAERVPLKATGALRVTGKAWRGVLTAAHIEKYGERCCPKCELRLAIGDTVSVPAGGDLAFHESCKPKPETGATGLSPRGVKVFAYAHRHAEKKPGSACAHCCACFTIGESVAWRFGWTAMLHESCWLELGKPDSLAAEKSTA